MSSRRNRNRGRNAKNSQKTSNAQGTSSSANPTDAADAAASPSEDGGGSVSPSEAGIEADIEADGRAEAAVDAASPAASEHPSAGVPDGEGSGEPDVESAEQMDALEGADAVGAADVAEDAGTAEDLEGTDAPEDEATPEGEATPEDEATPEGEATAVATEDAAATDSQDAHGSQTPTAEHEEATAVSSPEDAWLQDAWLQDAVEEPEIVPAADAGGSQHPEAENRWTGDSQDPGAEDRWTVVGDEPEATEDAEPHAADGVGADAPSASADTIDAGMFDAIAPDATAPDISAADVGASEAADAEAVASEDTAAAVAEADAAGSGTGVPAAVGSGDAERGVAGRDFLPAFPVPVTMSAKAKKFGWSREALLPGSSDPQDAPQGEASGERGAELNAEPTAQEAPEASAARAPRRPTGAKPGRGKKKPRLRQAVHSASSPARAQSPSPQEPSTAGPLTAASATAGSAAAGPSTRSARDGAPAATSTAQPARAVSPADSAVAAAEPRPARPAEPRPARPAAPSSDIAQPAQPAQTAPEAGAATTAGGEGPFQRVLEVLSPYLQRHRAALLTGAIALLLSVWMLIALPFPLKYAVDAAVAATGADLPALEGLDGTAGKALTTSVIVLGGLLLLQVITRFVAVAALGRVGARIATSLRSRLLAHLHRLTPGAAGHPASAARAARHSRESDQEALRPLIDDVASLRDLLSHSGPRAAASAITLLSLLVVTVIIDPLTALVLLVTGALFALTVGVAVRRSRVTEAAAESESRMLADTADELVAATGTIQSYGLESRSERGLTEAGVRAGRALTRARRSQALLQLLTLLVSGIGVVATLLLGGPRVADGTMTPGDLVMLLADVLIVVVVLRELLQHGASLKLASAAGDRISALLERQAGITEPPRTQPVESVGGEIVFSAVNTALTSEDGPDDRLFDTVSLVVPSGQHVALLDREGRESSALIAYLLRFDQPDTGRVLLDRFDTRAVSLGDLRRQIAVVQREPVLFTDTVRENIRIGRPEATDAEVAAAASKVGLDDVIGQLPQGFDTVLVSRGNMLTDGQRRRVAIARALLRDAPIVVLDAADAGLSGAERRPVMAALTTLVEGRTAIVSSRDPETVTAMDRVLWFEGGGVQEDGAPSALSSQEGSRLAHWLHSQDESV